MRFTGNTGDAYCDSSSGMSQIGSWQATCARSVSLSPGRNSTPPSHPRWLGYIKRHGTSSGTHTAGVIANTSWCCSSRLPPPPGADPPDYSELQAALAALRPADREALRLTFWEQFSAAEVAKVLNCTEQAAWKRLSRAKSTLRGAMRRPESEPPCI